MHKLLLGLLLPLSLLAQDSQRFNPPGLQHLPEYAEAVVKPGTMIFLSGQVAVNGKDEPVGKRDLNLVRKIAKYTGAMERAA